MNNKTEHEKSTEQLYRRMAKAWADDTGLKVQAQADQFPQIPPQQVQSLDERVKQATTAPKKRRWVRVGAALAACLMLVALALPTIRGLMQWGTVNSMEAGASEAPAYTTDETPAEEAPALEGDDGHAAEDGQYDVGEAGEANEAPGGLPDVDVPPLGFALPQGYTLDRAFMEGSEVYTYHILHKPSGASVRLTITPHATQDAGDADSALIVEKDSLYYIFITEGDSAILQPLADAVLA